MYCSAPALDFSFAELRSLSELRQCARRCGVEEWSLPQAAAAAARVRPGKQARLVDALKLARPSPIPSLHTQFTRAGIEWRR